MIYLIYPDGPHASVGKIMGRHPSVESAQGARNRLIDRAATMGASLPTIQIVDGRESLPEGTALELSSVRLVG
jgi:hypothetical protein